MSSTFQQGFPELWKDIQPVFDNALRTCRASDVIDIPLMSVRNGFLEETYFTGNFIPIRDIDGSIGGFLNSTHEVTRQWINERRTRMFNLMTVPSQLPGGTFASHVIPHLETNPRDITMALLYEADTETNPGTCRLTLQASIGVPAAHELAVEHAEFGGSEGLIPLFRKARTEIVTLPVDHRFEGIAWRGFEEGSQNFSIIPLNGAGRLFGFLVVGVNPRRAIDADHEQFVRDLSLKVSAIAASIVNAEESRKRSARLEKELRDSENQIRYMAQHASVGMQHLSLDGDTIWANEQYYNLTGHPRPENVQYKYSYLDVLHDEDRDKALAAWDRLIKGEPNISVELRLKRMYTPPSGDPEPTHTLALAFPYIEGGQPKSIMSCTMDISRLKWAESIEARNAADAREAKRQQEEFIDIVSHEMRNPLSAIFQCADMIQTSNADAEYKGSSYESLLETLQSNVEHSKTILMCANHQKRIVDDVLTLSKLEYMMLSVSPRQVELATLVKSTLKMFEADLQSHSIKVSVAAEPLIEKHDLVLCDPSRVAQIFINLLTNSIKFTRAEPRREITIRYGTTVSNPRNAFQGDMNWAPNDKKIQDVTTAPEWGTGELVYLTVSISDTGVGMTNEEIKKLFNRFKQASSRTSIKYGGSGLGLFISQKLTEKQGGEIGVASPGRGMGSTFVFYIKARRTEPETAAMAMKAPRPVPVRSASTQTIGKAKTKIDEKSTVNLDNIHVLLVEDNIVNQKILRKQLMDARCVVYVANHGEEALQVLKESSVWYEPKLESKKIDIILMDWEMPVMDGLTCSREIRKLEREGKVKERIDIIATTANARDEQIRTALESGIDSVMSKPFLVKDLLTKMREQLGRDREKPFFFEGG